MRRGLGRLVLAAAWLAGASAACAAPLTLRTGGSAGLAPLFQIWARGYAERHPEVRFEAAGDRKDTADVFAGGVDIGASDTFLTEDEVRAHPGFMDIALATSAVAIAYHVPGLKAPLKLDGPTLAAIYRGVVRNWDDKAIAELNPDAALPHREIVPLRRTEGSGETVAFAQYLATGPREDDYGTLERPIAEWSERRALLALAEPHHAEPTEPRAARDDEAMVTMLAAAPYAIGYVSYPSVDRVKQARLGIAALRNQADEFLQPDVRSINAAAAALTLPTPVDERISLVDAPGTGCYPLIAYAYAVVATRQPDAAKALALRDFLEWAIARDVASFERIEAAGLVALRSSTWLASLSQIDRIR